MASHDPRHRGHLGQLHRELGFFDVRRRADEGAATRLHRGTAVPAIGAGRPRPDDEHIREAQGVRWRADVSMDGADWESQL